MKRLQTAAASDQIYRSVSVPTSNSIALTQLEQQLANEPKWDGVFARCSATPTEESSFLFTILIVYSSSVPPVFLLTLPEALIGRLLTMYGEFSS